MPFSFFHGWIVIWSVTFKHLYRLLIPFLMMEDSKNSALAPTRTRHKVSNQSKNAKWTQEENEYLTKLVSELGTPNWNDLVSFFPGKSAQQIAERWEKVLNPNLVKGSWTREEDELIIKFVQEKGTKDWTKLATLLPGRIGKQCRERWRNHLDPDVNRAPWTEEEDQILIEMFEKIGSKWVKIAEYLPGRSDNAIKNRWNSTLKKRLEYQRNGGQRPKRGRPSQKTQAARKMLENKPKSADDVPKPPKFDEIAPEIKGLESPCHMSAMVMTPQLLSPFTGLKSPFPLMSPAMMKEMGGFGSWSPTNDADESSGLGYSPQNMFSPSTSLKEKRAEFLNLLSPMLPK